jgi:hypothetical protein
MDDRDMEHLGDGVYASHDGYQIWLRVNDHRSAPLVALDRRAFSGLLAYAKRIGIMDRVE